MAAFNYLIIYYLFSIFSTKFAELYLFFVCKKMLLSYCNYNYFQMTSVWAVVALMTYYIQEGSY